MGLWALVNGLLPILLLGDTMLGVRDLGIEDAQIRGNRLDRTSHLEMSILTANHRANGAWGYIGLAS